MFIRLGLVLCLLIPLLSCGDDGDASDGTVFAGYCKTGVWDKPCFWRNGQRTDLNIGTAETGKARAAVFDGNVLWIGGSYNLKTPCLWKDGVRIDLPFGTNSSAVVTGLVPSPTGLLASGTVNTDTGNYPCYWVGTNFHILSAETGEANSIAYKMTTTGPLLVLGGSLISGARPCIWINDVVQKPLMVMDTRGKFHGVLINADDSISAAGEYFDGLNTYGCLWNSKDATVKILKSSANGAKDARAYCIADRNGEAISAGYELQTDTNQAAAYWVYTAIVPLPSTLAGQGTNISAASAFAVAIVGGEVVAAGCWRDTTIDSRWPCFWKSGSRTIIARENGVVNAIAVKD